MENLHVIKLIAQHFGTKYFFFMKSIFCRRQSFGGQGSLDHRAYHLLKALRLKWSYIPSMCVHGFYALLFMRPKLLSFSGALSKDIQKAPMWSSEQESESCLLAGLYREICLGVMVCMEKTVLKMANQKVNNQLHDGTLHSCNNI